MMSGSDAGRLAPSERQALSGIADVLIPGGAGMPSASAAGILDEPLDRVLVFEPTLLETLANVAKRDGSATTVVEALRQEEPHIYERLLFALSAAYFLVPAVRRALGYPGVAPRRTPAAADEADYYLEDNVLGAVVDRGAIYRSAP